MHNFDEIVNRKHTYSTQWDYIADRFGKSDLLPFSISDTDFKMPAEVQIAIAKFNELGIYGYTRWNHDQFKSAIANHYLHRFGITVDQETIIYSPSVMYSVSILLRELALKKKAILTFTPMYDSFFQVIEENSLKLVQTELVNDGTGTFEIDFQDFEKKVKEVDVFLLCSPHNPTGRLWTNEELSRIVHLCKKENVAIVSDEIHMDINLTKRKHIPILAFLPEYKNMYLVTSASKTFNTPGLGGSYGFIPNQIIRERFLTVQKKRDFLNSASTLGIIATMAAYNECEKYIDEMCQYVRLNLITVEQFIKEHIPEIEYHLSDATYLAWIDCRRMSYTMDELQDALINVGKVGIMDGKIYGGNRYLRMNCGCPLEKVKQGLQGMDKAFEYLRMKKETNV
ncbi:MalY/PatB family protein [Enterococcus camelliae]|uniref:cysteine-S-conjugate beta-lyase n=1 Tax=Enterococcus camelliae TaxID=453959 RepID=A0ABW5TMP7_9ENTE